MKEKTTSFSKTIKTEVVCPNDTNPMHLLKGGRLVEWMDMAAAVCAQTHSKKICVTASINNIDFYAGAKVGDIITVIATITRSFTTSMEIFVQSFARGVLAGKKRLISQAYFTFVALDENGKASPVIPVKPSTEKEKQQFKEALSRRNLSEHF